MTAERPARSLPAWIGALGWLTILAAGIVVFAAGLPTQNDLGESAGGSPALVTLGIVVVFGDLVALRGFLVVQPNHARVVVLLGRYRGTLRTPGFRFINPLAR
ncbi:MAG TPA: hypothetical protein VGH94_10460, partial [Acidimicrobiales bacterium]